MTRQYPYLGSASDWSCHVGNLHQPIKSTTLIWVVTRHQYGISGLFREETSWRRVFSQPTVPVVFWQYDVHPGAWLADIPLCWIVHLPYCVSKGSCGIHHALCSYIKFLASNHVTNVSPTNYFILFVFFCRKTFIESCIVFFAWIKSIERRHAIINCCPSK